MFKNENWEKKLEIQIFHIESWISDLFFGFEPDCLSKYWNFAWLVFASIFEFFSFIFSTVRFVYIFGQEGGAIIGK